ESEPISSSMLAARLGVSSRTIKNDIHIINKLTSGSIESSNKGYKLKGNLTKEDLNSILDTSSFIQSERLITIVITILSSKSKTVHLLDLSDQLFISDSLLRKDIALINNHYSDIGVQIRSKNDFLYIEGNEISKRTLIIQLINDEGENYSLSYKQLNNYFDDVNFNKMRIILNEKLYKYGLYINDFAKRKILLHVAIMILRKNEDFNLTIASKFEDNDPKFEMVNEFILAIEEDLSVSFTDYEKKQIYLLILSNSIDPETEVKIENPKVYDFLTYLVKEIKSKYFLDFNTESFMQSFSFHLENLIQRLNLESTINNPLKEQLRQSSAIIYDIALFIAEKVTTHFNLSEEITEDELSFIVIHLELELKRQYSETELISCGLLIPNYQLINKQVFQKLSKKYGNEFSVIQTYHTIEEINENNPDILITTMDDINLPFNTINISPFLTNEDYLKIDNAILNTKTNIINQEFQNKFDVFFKKKFFFIQTGPINEKKAIKIVTDKLYEEKYIDNYFMDSVLERENALSTAYNNFSIPHSVSPSAYKSTIGELINPNGIKWNNKKVKVMFLMVICPTELNYFQTFY